MDGIELDDAVSAVKQVVAGKRGKVISPKVHGYLDYSHAATFLVLGAVWWKKNKAASIAALATGSFVLVQSLLTDYPLGVKKVISFETHGKMDGVFASTSWMIPHVCGFGGTPEARFFEANAGVEGTIAGLTDFKG